MNHQQTYPFQNYPLPYAYDALEPYIDEKTMRLHHDRHLQTYIDNLNKTLADYPKLHSWTLEDLLRNIDFLPVAIQIPVWRNAGGVYNHQLFFQTLKPAEAGNASLEAIGPIMNYFGGMEAFKEQMTEAALSVFGSGYAWLVMDPQKNIMIMTTANQDTPIAGNLYPLLLVDVWEHAYYLKYYNVRADYVKSWFSIINWQEAAQRFAAYHEITPSSF